MIEAGNYYDATDGSRWYVYQIAPDRDPFYPVRARCSKASDDNVFTRGEKATFTTDGEFFAGVEGYRSLIVDEDEEVTPPKFAVGQYWAMENGCVMEIKSVDSIYTEFPIVAECVREPRGGAFAVGEQAVFTREGFYFVGDEGHKWNLVSQTVDPRSDSPVITVTVPKGTRVEVSYV